MRLLLTRPREDAERSARRLAALGHEIEIEPLLTIRFRPQPQALTEALSGAQALAVTSVNGLRALLATEAAAAGATIRRNLPLFAVGPASAEAARTAGFSRVEAADGDAAALADLLVARLAPQAGAVVHPAGTVSAGGLAERLAAAAFELRRLVLYEAAPARRLGERTRAALHARAFDGVLFYSPRTAATFVSLVREAGLERQCAALAGYCLSPAVAAALAPLRLRHLHIATEPSEAALLQTVEAEQKR